MTRFVLLMLAVGAMVLVASSDAQAQCYRGGGGGYYGGHGHYGGNYYRSYSPRVNVSYARPYYGHSHVHRHYAPRTYGYYGGGYGGHIHRGYYGGHVHRGYGYGYPGYGRGGISIGFRF